MRITENFRLISIVESIESVIKALIVLSCISFIGIKANLISILVSSIFVSIFYFINTSLYIRFQINVKILFEQLRKGVPLALVTISYGLEIWIERILIVSSLGLKNFGEYMFLFTIIQSIGFALNNFMVVYSVKIYKRFSSNNDFNSSIVISFPTLILCIILPFFIITYCIIIHSVNHFMEAYNYTSYSMMFGALILVFQFIPVFLTTGAISEKINGQFILLLIRTISIFSFILMIYLSKNNYLEINIYEFKFISVLIFSSLLFLIFYKKLISYNIYKFTTFYILPSLLLVLLIFNYNILHKPILILSIIIFIYLYVMSIVFIFKKSYH